MITVPTTATRDNKQEIKRPQIITKMKDNINIMYTFGIISSLLFFLRLFWSMDLVNLHLFRISNKKKFYQITTEEDKFDAIYRITVKQFAPV